jgi:hypothetical protein
MEADDILINYCYRNLRIPNQQQSLLHVTRVDLLSSIEFLILTLFFRAIVVVVDVILYIDVNNNQIQIFIPPHADDIGLEYVIIRIRMFFYFRSSYI